MNNKESTKSICQSCGLSNEPDEKGTEVDGTLNDDYCDGCYEHGEFIEPEITLEKMIEKSATSTTKSQNMTLEEARNHHGTLLPTLIRWRHTL